MNTQFIYISNIPSNFKPVLLLHELRNKWARMLYLENTFSGLRDAFVFNPTDNYEHFCNGVQNLRNKEIDGIKPLSVFFVWFPPMNVFITTMIPAGASMLSYLFVENLHKDVIPSEVIYDLPLQGSDIKNWDIPERQDKCVIVKLPPNCNAAMRSFVLGTLRSRPIRGQQVRVSELIISEQNQLSNEMVPRSVKVNDTKEESYLSNFLYIHDIPANLTAKMLVDLAKADNIRGARVFFVETNKNMKYGFLYVPRSLPNTRFMALYEKIKTTEFQINDNGVGRVKIEKSWFQPSEAEVPIVEDDKDAEMLLTEYLHLSGIPPEMHSTQLALASPFPVKLYLFNVNEVSTQIGFIVLRGLSEFQSVMVLNYFRSLTFGGVRIQVDEIYLECRGLIADISSRPFQFQPRQRSIVPKSIKRTFDEGSIENMNGIKNEVVLTVVPEDDSSLMKTEFLFVDNLPKNVSKAALIFDIGRASDGCIVITGKECSTALIYFPDCDVDTWKNIIKRLSTKNFGIRKSLVYEVYLLTEFTRGINDESALKDTNIVFVYNIAREVNVSEIIELAPAMIESAQVLETTSGSKSAFVTLREGCTSQGKVSFVYNIRKQFLRGKPICADLMKIAPVGPSLSMVVPDSKKSRYFE